MLPPRCPGTLVIGLCPITFLLLLVFARLNPASSTYINSCWISAASICKTLWNTVKDNRMLFDIYCTAFVLCQNIMSSAQYHTIVRWTIHTSTYSLRRCFTLSEFLSNGTRYSCFLYIWFFLRIRPNVDRETRWMLLKIWSLLMILAWISRSLIQLLVKTMFTMVASCARVNIGPLPPWCPRSSILCKKKKKKKIHMQPTVKCHSKQYWW